MEHRIVRQSMRASALIVAALALLMLGGCLRPNQPDPTQAPLVYAPAAPAPADDRAALAARFAPRLRVFNPEQAYNRLGKPVASLDEQGWERISMDPGQPALYYEVLSFRTARGRYTNLVYRAHFPGTPFSLAPFFLGAGENLGLLVVITLDEAERPVLVATVGTCGCYLALMPTDLLPVEALPADWTGQPLENYGETLPARLDWSQALDPVLLVSIRPGEHRVMDVAVAERAGLASLPPAQRAAAELLSAASLRRLPLGAAHTSLYHELGPLSGHVKGAWKPWETLLMSWFSLDLLVGMDKAYPARDNPFYTSLKPWARQDSDLRDYPRFLRYWGWRL